MNFKKIAITAAAAGVMLGAALPAFASHLDSIVFIDNNALVSNDVLTIANTGVNGIFGSNNDGSIDTGSALAVSGVTNTVNTNIVDLCGCFDDLFDGDDNLVVVLNDATVSNDVLTIANTGVNGIFGSNNDGSIDTGSAGAGSAVTNVVNTNIVG